MTRRCWSRDYWMARGVVPRWQLFSIYLLILAAGFVGFQSLENKADDLRRQGAALKAESIERKDQNCIVFERQWQADVRNLTGTYQYLADLSAQQRREHLNRTIRKNLPLQESTEKANRPPTYCKGKVGLDDTKFLPTPKRPPELR